MSRMSRSALPPTAAAPPSRRPATPLLLIACVACLLEPMLLAVGPQQAPPANPKPTFRVAENLATIDAVVTDKEGQQVRNLGPEDFEVRQRGRELAVRQVVYIDATAPSPIPESAPTSTLASRSAATTTAPVEAPTTTRTVALVVDDLGLSFASTYEIRKAVTKFVDSQILPEDIVAIVRTGGRRRRAATAHDRQAGPPRRDRQHPLDRREPIWHWIVHPGQRLQYARPGRTQWRWCATGRSRLDVGAQLRGCRRGSPEDGEIRNTVLASAWLNSLEFVIRGMQVIPGRKAVVVFSEGFDMLNDRLAGEEVWHSFIRLMNRANRAGVVVYTVDPRGLLSGGITAEDNPQPKMDTGGGLSMGDPKGTQQREVILNALKTRHDFLRNSQDALYYMAAQTGGLAIQNTNDLSRGLGRILDDLKGYYLIGYDTPEGRAPDWEHAPVSLHLKRSGLSLRSRQGEFGPATKLEAEAPLNTDPLVSAALSPFRAGAVRVRLNALFARSGKAGYLLQSHLYFDGMDVPLVKGSDGRYQAELEIGELLVADNGVLPATARRTLSLTLDDDQYRQMMAGGMVYTLPIALKEPGVYQVRAAVRDTRTGSVGFRVAGPGRPSSG